MTSTPPSGAVRTGHVLVTVLLVLTLAFGVFMLVSVVVGLARDGDSLLYGDTVTVPVQLSPEDIGSLPHNLRLSGSLEATLEVHDPTSEVMFLRSTMDFGPNLAFAARLWLLRCFMQSVVKGDPFGPRNVRRLLRLGFLLVVGAPVVEVVNTTLRLSLFNNLPSVSDVAIGVAGFNLPAAALLGGQVAFILSEAFAYGLRLREDAEGPI